MAKRIYVGNLSYDTTAATLEQLFAEFGTVSTVNLIIDKFSGRSKGFAFVEMSSDEEFSKALSLNGREVDGRVIVVNEARPQEERSNNRDDSRGGGQNRGGGFSRNKRW